jgi:hypothetical protein
VSAAAPVPKPIFDVHALAANNFKAFTARSAIEISQGGQLSWPITCTGNFAINRVSVQLRGFFHRSTQAVSVYLEHDGQSALVAPTFGRRDELAYGHTNKREVLSEKPLRLGRDYTFSDGNFSSAVHDQPNALNLALGAAASQSSTYASYEAELAVDGNVYGLRSEYAVSMTTGEEQNRFNEGVGDHEPWWEVDLGDVQPIGTVVLWAPETEPTVRALEVQVITVTLANVTAAEEGDYWYTLKFSYGGTTYETSAIDFDAAACGDVGCQLDDASGESLQAKLQELPNVWHVNVMRKPLFVDQTTGATPTGSDTVHVGYSYEVTFVVPVRGIPALQLGDFFDFGSNVTAAADVVNVATQREAEVVEMAFEPASASATALGHVIVSDVEIPRNASLADALQLARWHRRIEYGAFRESKVLVSHDGETPVEGRYVRVQLEEYHSLQLAEVEVFAAIAGVARNYHGGSPITADHFVSEVSLSETFRHLPALGSWVLRIVDHTDIDDGAYDDTGGVYHNEVGALNDWVLTVQDQAGGSHNYYTGVSTEVQTLPACGTLYKVLADGVSLEEIKALGNTQRQRDRCSVRVKEHVRADFNKVLPTEHLLYVPDKQYAGRDALSFVTVLAGQTSESAADVELVVKPCLEQICTRVVDTISCYNPDPDCDVDHDPSGFDTWVASSQLDADGAAADPFRVNSFDGVGEAAVDATGDTSAQEIQQLGPALLAYENLGSGYCRSAGRKIEMCYYPSGYEDARSCAALCSGDPECQAYALGVWPGSREGTQGMTLNWDNDDDDIESPWDQDNYIASGTAGWCMAYTTAACAGGGVKANEGLPGDTLLDSDDRVHLSQVDGSSGDGLFAGCMRKTGRVADYFCWSGSEAGYCDDSLDLVSYSFSLAACREACLGAANNTGLGTTTGCTGVAFASTGYCYVYDKTAAVAECSHWYPRQEAAIADITSYFIQPCADTTQQD